MNPLLLLLLSLILLLLPEFSVSDDITPTSSPAGLTSTIYRETKQQIIASIPPGPTTSTSAGPTTTPFLTSPSGKYTASFLRTPTALGAGGFGNDFCFIQVTETETEQILWQSECGPVSISNTCTLVFDDEGLEVFDGSRSVYNTEGTGDHVNMLQLVDEGDMRIIDRDGELGWKASDEPRVGQKCGLPGGAGLAHDSPPFAGQIGGRRGPFGEDQQPAGGDESGVYDNGSGRQKKNGVEVFGLVVAVSLIIVNGI